MTIERTEQGSRVTFTGNVAEATVTRLAAALKSADTRASLEAEAKRHKAVWQNHTSPAQRGVPFLVPQLCFKFDGELELAEKDAFLDASGWSLLDHPAEISEADFRLTETGVQWEIDLSAAGKITEKAIGKADQYNLDLVDTGWTEQPALPVARAQGAATGHHAARVARIRPPRHCVPDRKARLAPHRSRSLEIHSGEGSRAENQQLPPTGSDDRYQQNAYSAQKPPSKPASNSSLTLRPTATLRTGLMSGIPTSFKSTITPRSESWRTKARNTNARKPSI